MFIAAAMGGILFLVFLMLGENKNNFWLDFYLGDFSSLLKRFAPPITSHYQTLYHLSM